MNSWFSVSLSVDIVLCELVSSILHVTLVYCVHRTISADTSLCSCKSDLSVFIYTTSSLENSFGLAASCMQYFIQSVLEHYQWNYVYTCISHINWHLEEPSDASHRFISTSLNIEMNINAKEFPMPKARRLIKQMH